MEFVVENVGHLKNVSESLLLVAFNRLMLFSIEIRSSYISGRAMASSLSDAWVFVASFFCWLEGILPQFSDISDVSPKESDDLMPLLLLQLPASSIILTQEIAQLPSWNCRFPNSWSLAQSLTG